MSKNADLFHDMDEEEESDVRDVIGKINNISDARTKLGIADTIRDYPQDDEPKITRPLRGHQFFRRWKTICLSIMEMSDGTLQISYSGKYKGDEKFEA